MTMVKLLVRDCIGIIDYAGSLSMATRLYMRSFDHGSHQDVKPEQGDRACISHYSWNHAPIRNLMQVALFDVSKGFCFSLSLSLSLSLSPLSVHMSVYIYVHSFVNETRSGS